MFPSNRELFREIRPQAAPLKSRSLVKWQDCGGLKELVGTWQPVCQS